VYVGITSPRVHIVDHITYCYTVLLEMGCDMVFLVSELGFEFDV